MATTIITNTESPVRISLIYAAMGIALGLVYVGLAALINHFIISPLFCGVNSTAVQCSNVTTISGSIATILVAVGAVFLGIRLVIARPLLVVLFATAFVWSLSQWTNGMFWLEGLGWSALIYVLAYLLFGWISRYSLPVVIVIISIVIIVAERIALAL